MAKSAVKPRVEKRQVERAVVEPAGPPAWVGFLERHARAIALTAVLLATVRIAATYSVFGQTMDEPGHILAGMEWLRNKSFTWEAQHPPLARIATALGPYLLGRHAHGHRPPGSNMWELPREMARAGAEILQEGGQYQHTLTAARLGVLPFFWLACFTVWEWGRRYHGAGAGALAVAIFTFIPSILAHAGLATTDMALTACLGAALLAARMWVERPDTRRSLLLGVTAGLSAVVKLSSLAFFPAAVAFAALVSLAIHFDRERLAGLLRRWPMLLLAAASGWLVIWATYRFSFHGVPAPEFFQGIRDLAEHNATGHGAYFFGQWSQFGWWYFFPVMLGVKTPLALLIVLALWIFIPALRREAKSVALPLSASAAILAVGMAASINIGLRHILPIYLGLSIVAAVGVVKLVERHWRGAPMRFLLIGLALWFAGSSLAAHPDYIPYFNELALGQPEKIAIDSDLEWGQDLKRVAARLRELGATDVAVITGVVADFPTLGFPPGTRTTTDPTHPTSTWTAMDIVEWKFRMGLGTTQPELVLWTDRVAPVEKVGAGYYLWSAASVPGQ